MNRDARRNPPFRTLLGISVLWLSLSFVYDGMATLVLPHDLGRLGGQSKATLLGVLTFAGLVVAMAVQPFAGILSDRTRDRWGRRGVIRLGLALSLPSLALYSSGSLAGVAAGFVLVLAAASVAQAGLQGFVPDLVPAHRRGLASGLKGFMDLAGATAGFVFLGEALGSGGAPRAVLLICGMLAGGYLLTVALVREPLWRAEAASGRREPDLRPAPANAAPEGRGADRPAPAPSGNRPDLDFRNPFRIDFRVHRAFAWVVVSRFAFLLGTFSIGRFFLFFVGERLGLDPDRAAEQAGALLGGLTLLTMLAAPAAGHAADRWGRTRLMYAGALVSAAGILGLLAVGSSGQIFAFGTLMAAGNACFTAANWALTADLAAPAQAGRFFALANFGTMGAAACAGLLGPVIDGANRIRPGSGYTALFLCAALASLLSIAAVRKITAGPESPAGRKAPDVSEGAG